MSEDMADDPRLKRLQNQQGSQSKAWEQTLEDMDAIADDRTAAGWDVVTVMAVHTDTVSRDMGEEDDFGLKHIIPDNHAERFTEAFDDGYTEYLAYGTDVDGYMFAVTELIDPEEERSILVANRYDMTRSRGMVQNAYDEGVLYSYFKTIDGTILGRFEHEEFEPLIKKPT